MIEIVSRKNAKAGGLVRYFTGVPCYLGHVSERLVSCAHCIECAKGYRAKQWRTNPNRRQKDRERKERVREFTNVTYRKQYAQNPERYRAKARRAYWKSPENYRQRRKEYQKRAPEVYLQKARDRTRQWALDNPDRAMRNAKVAKHKRRSRERGATGSFDVNNLTTLFTAQSGRCVYCKDKLDRKYHVDHIVPLSKGGSNDPANLQLLCASCNLSKASSDPIVYAQSLGFLL